MTVEKGFLRLALSSLVLRDKNPNVMDPAQFDLLVESIRKVGFLQPLLVRPIVDPDDPLLSDTMRAAADAVRRLSLPPYEVVDGAHRYRAAIDAGLTVVSAVVCDADDDQAVALQIGMNRLRGELDLGAVAAQMQSLVDAGWSVQDLTITGFSVDETSDLLKSVQPSNEDVMGSGTSAPASGDDVPLEEDPDKTYPMELVFLRRKDMQRAKKALKSAAGRGGTLAEGLLALIDDDASQ